MEPAQTSARRGGEWLVDPIHPNGAGRRQFAAEFFRTIAHYDPTTVSTQP